MKNWTQKAVGLSSVALTFAAVACVWGRMPKLQANDAAFAAAGFILPGGAAEAIKDNNDEQFNKYLIEDEEDNQPEGSSSSVKSNPSSKAESKDSPKAPASSAAPKASSLPSHIKEMKIPDTGIKYQNIWVKNLNKKHDINVAEELKKRPAVKIIKNSSPQVLIYHTHTTEAYLGETRSRDNNKNMVAVGNKITEKLKSAGINTVHDTTCHDYPTYNGSYDRSKVTIQKNLKKYPGIQVTLDIHRDAMSASNGIKYKPTAVINGKKAAQLMIVSGCDDDGTLGFPNWEYNLRLAVRLQKSLADKYPGLARPLDFCARKYNENMTKGSLLIEIGTEVNTLDETLYTGELLGNSLVDVLNNLT